MSLNDTKCRAIFLNYQLVPAYHNRYGKEVLMRLSDLFTIIIEFLVPGQSQRLTNFENSHLSTKQMKNDLFTFLISTHFFVSESYQPIISLDVHLIV